jgi:hypothetical protein
MISLVLMRKWSDAYASHCTTAYHIITSSMLWTKTVTSAYHDANLILEEISGEISITCDAVQRSTYKSRGKILIILVIRSILGDSVGWPR